MEPRPAWTGIQCSKYWSRRLGRYRLAALIFADTATVTDYASLLPRLIDITRRAGRVVMEVYNSDFAVAAKDDKSPVTEADMRAEKVILAALAELTPDIPAVSEEAAAAGFYPDVAGGRFWLVDPVDGTKEFVKRNGEFTVNIGLIEGELPVLGVVFAPALDRLFAGAAPGVAFSEDKGVRRAIAARAVPPEGGIVLDSRSHRAPERLEAWMAERRIAGRVNAGSSLKFCLVAAGEADWYPRFGPTSEWDTAAGHAVLRAAGGSVVDFATGEELRYRKPTYLNPDFLAQGRK